MTKTRRVERRRGLSRPERKKSARLHLPFHVRTERMNATAKKDHISVRAVDRICGGCALDGDQSNRRDNCNDSKNARRPEPSSPSSDVAPSEKVAAVGGAGEAQDMSNFTFRWAGRERRGQKHRQSERALSSAQSPACVPAGVFISRTEAGTRWQSRWNSAFS